MWHYWGSYIHRNSVVYVLWLWHWRLALLLLFSLSHPKRLRDRLWSACDDLLVALSSVEEPTREPPHDALMRSLTELALFRSTLEWWQLARWYAHGTASSKMDAFSTRHLFIGLEQNTLHVMSVLRVGGSALPTHLVMVAKQYPQLMTKVLPIGAFYLWEYFNSLIKRSTWLQYSLNRVNG